MVPETVDGSWIHGPWEQMDLQPAVAKRGVGKQRRAHINTVVSTVAKPRTSASGLQRSGQRVLQRG